MTDIETIRAMLDRARIGYTEEPVPPRPETGHRPIVPEGCVALAVEGNGAEWQPFPGGYPGFLSELVFGPDGALLAVWAWE